MSHLLDTNAVVAIFKNAPGVRARFRQALQDGAIYLSSIVLFELWYGIAKSGRWQENAQRLRDFLRSGVEIIEFDSGDAQFAGELRETLSSRGRPVGPYDLLIAAQAIRRNLTLVTANMREFGRVDGLVCENWAE